MEKRRGKQDPKVTQMIDQRASTAIANAWANLSREPREITRPIYWIRIEDMTPEVLGQVIDVYAAIYKGVDVAVERPDFSNFQEEIARERLLEYRPLGLHAEALEVRTLVSDDGSLYGRFATTVSMDHMTGRASRRETFQGRIDELLIARQIAVPLEKAMRGRF